MKKARRISGVSVLAAAVLVLLPALAWLQYSWLDQIADADRDRRARTLQTAASQLAQEFESEMGRAVFALQLDPGTVEQRNWAAFSSKFQVWADAAASPRIVKGIYFVEPPDGERTGHERVPALRIWNPAAHSFDEIEWPAELSNIHARFLRDGLILEGSLAAGRERREADRRPDRGRDERDRGGRFAIQRMLFPPTPAGDAQSVMTPVLRIAPPDSGHDRPGPDVKLLGFTVVRFDLDALATDVLPALVSRHLHDDDGRSDYAVAVVSRDDPAHVIFESSPGAAATATDHPDVSAFLLGSRMGPFMFMARGDRGRWAGGPPPPGPPMGRTDNLVVIETNRNTQGEVSIQRTAVGDGHWRLVAKHRAGSLEAAVAATRTRNFALSSGILALLAAAIGLIVVSARRADRLARQQLEFVAAVSHELRTPVSVISAAAGNLADGVVGEPARVKKYGSTIQTEARRLAETVERVLQLAGIASGRGPAAPGLIPGQALITDALNAVRHEIESANVTVERAVPDALPSVQGDAMALRSALQNLIGNAVKYAGPARWVRIEAHAHGRWLRILVEDRGLGIGADERKQIFEPFYRGREAVARQIQGSGLGLHLVRRIIEAHGGTISVSSEPGRGSTFTIELPIASPSEAGAGAPAHSPAAAGL